MNPYAVLNIPHNASTEDAKKAYKKLANKHHPDKGGDEEIFKEVKKAYEDIKNKKSGNSHTFHNHNDIFNFYNTYARPQPPPTIKINATITVRDAVIGGDKVLGLPPNYGKAQEFITVQLPGNMFDNEVICFPKTVRGIDLYVRFTVVNDSNWEMHGADIYKIQKVNILELIIGTSILVTTLDNKTMKLNIPAKTEANTKMKIKGKGLVNRQDKRMQGDMYVVIKATMPTTISETLKQHIQKEISQK